MCRVARFSLQFVDTTTCAFGSFVAATLLYWTSSAALVSIEESSQLSQMFIMASVELVSHATAKGYHGDECVALRVFFGRNS